MINQDLCRFSCRLQEISWEHILDRLELAFLGHDPHVRMNTDNKQADDCDCVCTRIGYVSLVGDAIDCHPERSSSYWYCDSRIIRSINDSCGIITLIHDINGIRRLINCYT